MPLRAALCIAAAAALVLPPVARADHVVQLASVRATTVVPAGGTAGLTVECPGSSVALNAAVTRQRAADLRRSVPGRDAGDWRFRFFAPERALRRRVRVVLRCVGLQPPEGVTGTRLDVKTRGRTGIELDPGESKAIRIGCGPAWSATGYGLARGADGDVRLAAAVPTAHGWNFRLENIGSEQARAGVSVRCLRTRVRADGGETLAFRLTRAQFDDVSVSGGTVSFLHACARGDSVATGSAVDPLDAIALLRSHPWSSWGGRWTFGDASAGDQVRMHLVCLRRGSHFR